MTLTLAVYLASLASVMLLVRFLTGFPWITALFVGAVVATPAPPVIHQCCGIRASPKSQVTIISIRAR
jgi:NhaP-type Na+/H+ or K+/H+ antiporter